MYKIQAKQITLINSLRVIWTKLQQQRTNLPKIFDSNVVVKLDEHLWTEKRRFLSTAVFNKTDIIVF